MGSRNEQLYRRISGDLKKEKPLQTNGRGALEG
jgi:hypothetical protein